MIIISADAKRVKQNEQKEEHVDQIVGFCLMTTEDCKKGKAESRFKQNFFEFLCGEQIVLY